MFLDYYSDLAVKNVKAGRTNFKMRPKHHIFHHHLVFRLRSGGRLNPRVVSCWLDEDFIGKVCAVARSVHPATLGLRTLQRHQLEINRRLAQRSAV